MPRPPRIEFEGAFHHVMNRGRDNQAIYLQDRDYECFLNTLSEAANEHHAIIHAYCLMTNHYHLLKIRGQAHFTIYRKASMILHYAKTTQN